MSTNNRRIALLATVILSLGFAATGVAPASANAGQTQISSRASVYRPVDYRHVRNAYAGPMPSSRQVTEWKTRPNPQFMGGIDGGSCDLPSSGCSDNERITN